ncbi:glycosyltransferase [Streptomyces sp. NPDC006879]|uniref:glycosyltransferase n=1 Tax=Streptomyces sp. NPDC006879 TaxID=3364767 RepID=UPI0036A2EFC5
MRVLIVTAGTWGDVAPYTGLGLRLKAAGHEVSLATHTRFADPVTVQGLGFRPLPLDPREQLASVGQGLAHPGNLLALARLSRLARRNVPALAAGIVEALRPGADVVLGSTLTDPLCAPLGEALGIPTHGVYLQPVHPTRHFPPPVGIPSLGPLGNRLAGRAMTMTIGQLLGPSVSRLRSDLGLSKGNRPGTGVPGSPLVHHGFSPLVVPRPADWPTGHRVCGYWWPARHPHWQPPARLLDFLDAGPAPVFVGFGSHVAADAERLSRLVTTALRRARVRAVVQSGWSGLRAEGDEVLTVPELPHDWLFPRMAAVVHHAGAGTTAAGLRAGVPAVPVPVHLDQHFWATRLVALGVAPKALPYRSLAPEPLAAAIGRAVQRSDHRIRARHLAAALLEEDGAADVLHAVEGRGGGDRRRGTLA